MQFNQATDYAFRTVLHLAALPAGTVVAAQTIADEEKIPVRFLLKIMRSLTAAGIVKSYRGVVGGYGLGRQAGEITLLDVIEAMEGPIAIHRCLAERTACNKHCTEECPVHRNLAIIQDQFVAALRSLDFATLVAQHRTGKKGVEDDIVATTAGRKADTR